MRRVCHLALIASLTFVCAYREARRRKFPTKNRPQRLRSLWKGRPLRSDLSCRDGLTDRELATLRTLIEKKIVGLELKHQLSDTYEETHLFLSVVAEKFVSGGKTHFAVSSALSIGKFKQRLGR